MTAFRLPADDLEYAVLRQLWELGAASVRELHDTLGRDEGLVYTTIAKVVDRLRDKGLIQRRRRGPAFVYRARAAPEEVERARPREDQRRTGRAPERGHMRRITSSCRMKWWYSAAAAWIPARANTA